LGRFTPQPFGKYVLVDKIATGGMAEIFKAQSFSHGGFEHLLVIKRILEHLSDDDEFVEMFIDEAKVSVALQHPNIIRIYDFGKLINNYFIAMECVEGKDVRDLLRRLAKLRRLCPWEYSLFVALEASKGLQYAHTKSDMRGRPYRIVHRDMSPSNILISYDGEVKIADFGIAKAAFNNYNTNGGVLKGKYEYMSPEQAGGESLDHQSDLFSLGIVLHEMLTGRRLFRTGSDVETLEKIRGTPVEPPSKFNNAISPEVDRIVLKLLSIDRKKRYPSAAALTADLRPLLASTPSHQLSSDLANFVQEVFASEIQDERNRLTEGSVIARQLRAEMVPTQWDEDTDMSLTDTHYIAIRRQPTWMSVLAATVFAISVAISLSLVAGKITEQRYEEELANVQPKTTLDLMVLPPATVYVDEADIGEGRQFSLSHLSQGPHRIRFEAKGYQTSEHTIHLLYEKPLVLQVMLEPAVRVTSNDVERPLVTFSSIPPGATVNMNNVTIGKTPFTWTGGAIGSSYQVTLDLDGFHSTYAPVPPLSKVSQVTVHRDLVKESANYGNLSVVLEGADFAEVFVDDLHLPFNAPLTHPLSPGTYAIRVLNTSAGIQHTEQVTIATGHTTNLRVEATSP
jgi:serine/threonine protein kinase